MDSKQRWNKLNSTPRFMPSYPNDLVVAWVFRSFPRAHAAGFRILDLGCGAGRHSIFMAREGYQVTACDFSTAGLDETLRRANEAVLKVERALCEADSLDFSDNTFDGVVCFGVLYYLPYPRFLKAVKEIFRILEPGGKALVVTRSQQDSRCDRNGMIDRCTFKVSALGEGAPSNAEEGMTMTFVEKEDVESAFCDFKEIAIDRLTVTLSGGSFTDDDWCITAIK